MPSLSTSIGSTVISEEGWKSIDYTIQSFQTSFNHRYLSQQNLRTPERVSYDHDVLVEVRDQDVSRVARLDKVGQLDVLDGTHLGTHELLGESTALPVKLRDDGHIHIRVADLNAIENRNCKSNTHLNFGRSLTTGLDRGDGEGNVFGINESAVV